MFLSRLKSRNKNAAGALIFILLTPILFRLLYGVPPLPSDYVIDFASTTMQLESKSAPTTVVHADVVQGKTQPSSESTENKRLAPYKVFKNKIIKEKSFNPAEILDLRTIKFNPETPQLISPSQGKRFLTTHSNVPPSQK